MHLQILRFEIKNASKFKYMITTDLPSARAHRFKSAEQDFSIAFELEFASSHPRDG